MPGDRVVMAPPDDLHDGIDRHITKTVSAVGSQENRMATLIDIHNLAKIYVRGTQKIEVLHNIDLDDRGQAISWR